MGLSLGTLEGTLVGKELGELDGSMLSWKIIIINNKTARNHSNDSYNKASNNRCKMLLIALVLNLKKLKNLGNSVDGSTDGKSDGKFEGI